MLVFLIKQTQNYAYINTIYNIIIVSQFGTKFVCTWVHLESCMWSSLCAVKPSFIDADAYTVEHIYTTYWLCCKSMHAMSKPLSIPFTSLYLWNTMYCLLSSYFLSSWSISPRIKPILFFNVWILSGNSAFVHSGTIAEI